MKDSEIHKARSQYRLFFLQKLKYKRIGMKEVIFIYMKTRIEDFFEDRFLFPTTHLKQPVNHFKVGVETKMQQND